MLLVFFNRHIWRTDLLPRGRGMGEGWIASLGLADAKCYILNGYSRQNHHKTMYLSFISDIPVEAKKR